MFFRVSVLAALAGVLLHTSAWAATVSLVWNYVPSGHLPTTFSVYRQDNCAGPFVKIGDVSYTAASVMAFADTTVKFAQVYCWQVTALDSATKEETLPSNVLRFQVPSQGLAVPTDLRNR